MSKFAFIAGLTTLLAAEAATCASCPTECLAANGQCVPGWSKVHCDSNNWTWCPDAGSGPQVEVCRYDYQKSGCEAKELVHTIDMLDGGCLPYTESYWPGLYYDLTSGKMGCSDDKCTDCKAEIPALEYDQCHKYADSLVTLPTGTPSFQLKSGACPKKVVDAKPFGFTNSGFNQTGFGANIEGTAVDKQGNVYAVNYGTNNDKGTIGMVTPDGQSSLFFTSEDAGVAFNGIRINREGDMFLADYENNRVYKLAGGDPTQASVHCQFPSVKGLPNDLALMENGEIYASSMNFAANTGEAWWCSADGKDMKKAVAGDTTRTNGIEVSPDQKVLYVSEANGGNNNTAIDSNLIWSFKIGDNGNLTEKQVFFDFATLETEMEDIDGMRTDRDGNLWVSRNGAGRVVKLSPEGEFLQAFTTAITFQTNLEFGGPEGRTLYIVGRCNLDWGEGPGCIEKLETTGPSSYPGGHRGASFVYLHRGPYPLPFYPYDSSKTYVGGDQVTTPGRCGHGVCDKDYWVCKPVGKTQGQWPSVGEGVTFPWRRVNPYTTSM